MKNKKNFFALGLLIVFAVIGLSQMGSEYKTNSERSEMVYDVKEIFESYSVDEAATLYVASIEYHEESVSDDIYLYYFSDEDENGSNKMFVNFVFRDSNCIEENYVSGNTQKILGSSDGTIIFCQLFRLAGLTNAENPIYIVKDKGIVYGIIDKTAYILAGDEMQIPKTVRLGEFKEGKKKIVYAISYNGEFTVSVS